MARIINTVGNLIVVTEFKFCRITMKMAFTITLINTLHALVEDAKIPLNRFGINHPMAILAFALCREIEIDKP